LIMFFCKIDSDIKTLLFIGVYPESPCQDFALSTLHICIGKNFFLTI